MPTVEALAVEFAISPDLDSMYRLEPKDYNRVINSMTNLVISVILMLQQFDKEDTARAMGKAASAILSDYDPDVAELRSTVRESFA